MGRRFAAGTIVLLIGCIMAGPRPAVGQEKAGSTGGVDAKAAFKRIKSLAGTWGARITGEHQADKTKEEEAAHKGEAKVVYKITAGGSALTETQFPSAAHEMVSVYHLDGDDLRMTHYCSIGNQPRVKLDRAKSTLDHLIFVFDGGTNLDAKKDDHIHGLTITFHKDGHITSDWEGYHDGKSAGITSFEKSRQ